MMLHHDRESAAARIENHRYRILHVLGEVQIEAQHPARANPMSYLSTDTVPFLIVHGDADTRVGIGQSRRLYNALRDAGADVSFHVIPGANHAGPEFFSEEANKLAAAFLQRTVAQMR